MQFQHEFCTSILAALKLTIGALHALLGHIRLHYLPLDELRVQALTLVFMGRLSVEMHLFGISVVQVL